jgi:hypothetical protein
VRTLLLIVGMLLVALAAGLSFVLPAGAQTPAPTAPPGSVTLDASCDPPSVPAGVDSLITCTFIIRNGSGEVLPKTRLQFQPVADVSVTPPQQRYVFSERLDGAEQEVDPNDLGFFTGGIAPGGVRTAEFRIIVRSTYDFGMDAVVLAGADQREYARRTVKVGVGVQAPSVDLSLMYEGRISATQAVSLGLRIQNRAHDAIDSADVELEPGHRFSVADAHWKKMPIAGGSGLYLRYAGSIGTIAPGYISEDPISIQTAAGACLTPHPAVVASVHLGGRTLVLAALADVPPPACNNGEQAGAGLPATGSGPSDAGGRPPLPAALLVAVGLLCLAMGATGRCRRRRIRTDTLTH